MLHTCHWIRLYKQLNDKLQFLVKKPFWTFAPLAQSKEIKFPVRIQKFKAYRQTGTQDFTITYKFMVSWISEGVNSVYRQKKVPRNAKKVGDISLGSRCVEQRPLQFYNIINKQVNLYNGKWMLHSVIFPDAKKWLLWLCDMFILQEQFNSEKSVLHK